MGLNETKMMLVTLPGAGSVKTAATAVTILTLSAHVGKVLTFQAAGGQIWWAANGTTTGFTVATSTSLSLADGERWDALITRDRIVMKLKGGASRVLKYADTGG